MKTNSFALVLASAFMFLLAACGGTETPFPTETPVPPTEPPAVTAAPAVATSAARAANICGQGDVPTFLKAVTLTTDTKGANYEPVDNVQEYAPTQATFHVVAALDKAPQNTKMRAVWYLVRAEGYKPNNKIEETELNVDSGGTRNVDFTLKPAGDSWPSGTYCVEIYVNDTLALSKTFSVTGASIPSNATTAVLKQVVLADDINPNTFEPINPTIVFKKTAPFIHAALQIEKAPANTLFRARWYPPGQEPLDLNLTTDGTRWLDFHLTPSADGFPTGDYKVEIYVNDQLADTKTFTVE